MARKYVPENENARYSFDRPEHEHVYEDTDEGRRGETVTLRGEMIGMSAEELLNYAYERTRTHDGLVAKLVRHLPIKFEERIKALAPPQEEARDAIRAARIILLNAQRPWRVDR